MSQATNVQPLCRVCGEATGNTRCEACGPVKAGSVDTRELRDDLRPPLTPEQLEAKIEALKAKWPLGIDPRLIIDIRREFSGTAIADGVDWKERCEAAERSLRSVDLAIGNLAVFDGMKDRAEKINYAIGWAKRAEAAEKNYQNAIDQRNEAIRQRDAALARVKELEAKQEGLLSVNTEIIIKEREERWRRTCRSLAKHLAELAELEDSR